MRKLNSIAAITLIGLLTLNGCKDKEETDPSAKANLELTISGLEDLGPNFAYEGWLIVDGKPVTAGIFNVDDQGNLTKNSFELSQSDIEQATAYVLTIEPSPDSDPAPSAVHILAGNFSGNSAAITVDHGSAIGTTFTKATGSYILATPTDGGMSSDETSGVWWLDQTGPSPGLDLPTLPNGWEYEGWAVINGTPVSTGKFLSASGSDDNAPYSGATTGPPFPGEDFLMNAPSGLSFPLDLSESKVVISVEPKPDNSDAPFLLKPLIADVPASASHHTSYTMTNNAVSSNPTGTASR